MQDEVTLEEIESDAKWDAERVSAPGSRVRQKGAAVLALVAEVRNLRDRVKRWEDKEVHEASQCYRRQTRNERVLDEVRRDQYELLRENVEMRDNLTATQARCTKLLLENRELRATLSMWAISTHVQADGEVRHHCALCGSRTPHAPGCLLEGAPLPGVE